MICRFNEIRDGAGHHSKTTREFNTRYISNYLTTRSRHLTVPCWSRSTISETASREGSNRISLATRNINHLRLSRFALLLPSTAEGLIKLNERQTLVQLSLYQVKFRREIICFAGEHLEVTRAAVFIKHLR